MTADRQDPAAAVPDATELSETLGGLPNLLPLPRFVVRLQAPDLTPWLSGNSGIPGVMQYDSGRPGPHVMLTALMHGNEIAGAIVLDELLRQSIRPRIGRLTIAFLNLAAFARFDGAHPTLSRFVEEDMNRVWDRDVLDSRRQSLELDRARVLRPLIDDSDILLDLHSMLWPSEPLILCGATLKGRRLAGMLGTPSLIVSDRGHSSGPRLIDYATFTGDDHRTALLVEAGPHWERGTVETARFSVRALLRRTGLLDPLPPLPGPEPRPRCAEVTKVVTALTGNFSFTQAFRGGEIIHARDTLIGHDGATEIRTPHDECLLVMPSLRPSRGHTAVRLARILPVDG